MQTNLHRVSEFAVTSKQTSDDGNIKAEARTTFKRLLEHDSDTESEVDEIVGGNNISGSLPDPTSEGSAANSTWRDSSKSELDTSVFLSFDWENEEPYEKAVER